METKETKTPATRRTKSSERFQKAAKVASEAFKHVRATTTLEQWQADLSGEIDTEKITWRHVWYHVMSCSLSGLIRVVYETVKKWMGLKKEQVPTGYEFVIPQM